MKKITVLFTTLALVLGLCACTAAQTENSGEEQSQSSAQGLTWQEQFDLGVRYLSEGNYREAIIAFTAAIEIDPKQAEAYIGRGQAYVLSGETEENLAAAQADFETAIELDETLSEAWLGLSDIYIRRSDYDRALEILREGLEKTGGDQSIAGKIAEMESGNIKDSSGNLRRISSYDENGVLQWYHEYTYNAEGRQASVTHRDSAGNQLGHIDFIYDENGRSLVSYGNYDDGTLIKIEREYDGSGNMIKETLYDENGDVTLYRVFQYDENGNEIRSDSYGPDGTLSHYRVQEYNSDGLIIKSSDYDIDGNLLSYSVNEYNGDGKQIRTNHYSCYNGNEELRRYEIYRYNEQGEPTGMDIYDGDGNLQHSWSYES